MKKFIAQDSVWKQKSFSRQWPAHGKEYEIHRMKYARRFRNTTGTQPGRQPIEESF
jgi:hypothetical protein